MIIIGIDPGKTGSIAVLTYEIGKGFYIQEEVHDMPVIDKDYNEDGISDLLQYFSNKTHHVFIESVHAMPGQGVCSMFNFGKGFGIIRGILSAFKMTRTFVTPQAWKKEMMEGIKDKDAARSRAIQLFPHSSLKLCRKKDIGRADALLIAEYGRRKLGLK